MATVYPIPVFHFQVEWGGTRIGFTEVSGLTTELEPIPYREGSSKNYNDTKMPGRPKYSDISLKRGVFSKDNEFFQWISTVKLNQIERRLEREKPSPELAQELQDEFRVVKAELDRLRKAQRECIDISRTLESDLETGFNPYWGLHFKERNENSRFGEQVEQYACLYTSRVSNFVFYSPQHYFRSQREVMPHEAATAFKMSVLGSPEALPKGALRAADIP